MSGHIVDPFAAMNAACIAISNGEANEIELSFTRECSGTGLEPDRREDLTITVRREVRHFYPPPAASDDQGGAP